MEGYFYGLVIRRLKKGGFGWIYCEGSVCGWKAGQTVVISRESLKIIATRGLHQESEQIY